MTHRVAVLLLTFWAILTPAAAADTPAGTTYVDFFGYEDCVALSNDSTRVVLCHQAGGRVLEYSLEGTNVIYLDPAGAGSIDGGDGRANMTGGRFDIGPEQVVPRRMVLWQGAWNAQIIGPRQARLTSQMDPNTGVRLTREFRLDEDTSKLDCTQTIHNVSNEPKEYCHWSRTFAVSGGVVVVPLTPPSRFPNFYTMRRGMDELLIRPEDDHIRVREEYLEILAPPAHPKLGIESYAGWFAYAAPNDLLFIKQFPTFRGKLYSEVDGHNVSVWYPQDRPMIELEPLGPRERIVPGEEASFTETWQLHPFTFPADGESIDLKEIEEALTVETSTPAVPVAARQQSDAHALNTIFSDAFLEENGHVIQRRAARSTSLESFETLADCVLPSAHHPGLRLAVQFTEHEPASTAGGRITSPALDLIATAMQLGRLDEVRRRIEAAPEQSIDNQVRRLAGLVLVDTAAGEHEAVVENLTQLRAIVSARPVIQREWESPLLLALIAGGRHAEQRNAARQLGYLLVQTHINQIDPPDWRTFHRQVHAETDRIERCDEPDAELIGISSDPDEPPHQLNQWRTGSLYTAESQGTGCPPNVWSREGTTVRKRSGHSIDLLYFQSPLQGNFDVEYDATTSNWREIPAYYGGHWAGIMYNRELSRIGRLAEDRGHSRKLSSKMTKFRHELHYRVRVRDRLLTLLCNGHELSNVRLAVDHDPWLALRRSSKNSPQAWNVRVIGEPEIPQEIQLAGSSDLTSWVSYFDGLENVDTSGWGAMEGGIRGERLPDELRGSSAERLLYYHRPMLEDGEIEYEFFYGEDASHVHPALGRMAFVLDPEGVVVHRVTNGRFDRSTLPPDNREVVPDHRIGSAALPLHDAMWNRVRLTVTGNLVTVSLNNTSVYEQPIEPANSRHFGLFYDAAQTQATVREVRWRGDWPTQLPPLEEQELADDETLLLNASADRLPAVYHHTFDSSQFPSAAFRLVAGEIDEFTATNEGLEVRRQSTGRYKRSTLSTLLTIGGDFDITARFDAFVPKPGDGGHSSVALRVYFDDVDQSQINLRLRHNRFPMKDEQHLLYADFAAYPADVAKRFSVGYKPAANDSGTLRLARRGDRVYTLFAEEDSRSYRITTSYEVPPTDLKSGGVYLSAMTHLDSSVSARWKELTIRAERLEGPALDAAVKSK